MDGKSLDIAQDKLEKLKSILPEAFSSKLKRPRGYPKGKPRK